MIARAKWFADKLLRSNTPTEGSRRVADWLKVALLLGIAAAASRDKLAAIALPVFGVQVVSIPIPSDEMQRHVAPLHRARSTNPDAAAVVSDFLAAYAWLLEHDDTRQGYNSSALARNIESGLESLAAIRAEVGDIDLGPALNESLQAIWGDENRQLTKAEASAGVFACAWSLSK